MPSLLPHYVYRHLAEGEIRLIQLSDISFGPPLVVPSINIIHANLEAVKGEYQALSYVWGTSTTEEVPLMCETGCFFNVSFNLFAAISALLVRGAAEGLDTGRGGPIYVWIDAICIDQADSVEKSKQVSMMRDIYASAARTVAYLGLPADDSDIAIAFLYNTLNLGMMAFRDMLKTEDLEARVKLKFPRNNHGQHENSEFMHSMTQIERSAVLLEAFQSIASSDEKLFGPYHKTNKPRVLRSVGALLSRPYFQRSWIIQELAVAKETIMICGRSSFSLDVLGAVLSETLRVADADWEHHVRVESLLDFYKGAAGLVTIHSMQTQQRHRATSSNTLFRLLQRFRSAKATLAVDKVYAVLALSNDKFPVDYSKTKAETFVAVAEHLIINSGAGDLLLYEAARSEPHSDEADLPSWVPDWEHFPLRNNLGETMSSTTKWFFDASGAIWRRDKESERRRSDGAFTLRQPEVERMKLRPCGRVLVTEGAMVQKIAILGRPGGTKGITPTAASNAEHVAKVVEDMATYRDRLTLSGRDRYHTGEHVDAAVFSTLEGDSTFGGISNWNEERGVRALLYRIDATALADRLTGTSTGIYGELVVKAARQAARGEATAVTALGNMVKTTLGRRLAVTDQGYIGMVPADAKPGDRICILRGSCVPFLLRRVREEDANYRLMGDCYVHGIMAGELFRKEPAPEMEEICLV